MQQQPGGAVVCYTRKAQNNAKGRVGGGREDTVKVEGWAVKGLREGQFGGGAGRCKDERKR